MHQRLRLVACRQHAEGLSFHLEPCVEPLLPANPDGLDYPLGRRVVATTLLQCLGSSLPVNQLAGGRALEQPVSRSPLMATPLQLASGQSHRRVDGCHDQALAVVQRVDQPDPARLPGVHLLAGQYKFQALLQAHARRQPLRATEPRQQSQLDFRQGEVRGLVFARQDVVAGQHEFRAPAGTGAVHRRQDRLREIRNAVVKLLPLDRHLFQFGGRKAGEQADVDTRQEVVRLRRDHGHCLAGSLLLRVVEGLLQFTHGADVQGVHLGTFGVQPDDADAAAVFQGDHASVLSSSIATAWPPAAQAVTRASCPSSACSRLAAVVRRRAPVAPNG